MIPRVCIRSGWGGCSDNGIASPGSSRCKAHGGGKGWGAYAQKHPERTRLYDFSWQQRRKAQLAQYPDCQLRLPGCRLRATEVDHIVAVANGGDFNGPIQSVCTPCHRKKTAEDSKISKRRRKARG